jgi:hypothetical protein
MQSETMADSNWPFEVRVARVYTRAVFNRFKESMKSATAYRITADPERGMHSWLVQHTKTSKKLVWGQHQFSVTVDTARELFTCECRVMEQTGMTSHHASRQTLFKKKVYILRGKRVLVFSNPYI